MPIIAQKVGSREEFVKHDENGFLYKDGNLLETLRLVAEYPDYKRLSDNAYASFDGYETSHWTKRQIHVYLDALYDI